MWQEVSYEPDQVPHDALAIRAISPMETARGS